MASLPSTASAAAAAAPPAERPHVVLVASPGAGHLNPMAELARRFVEHHGFAATLVTFTSLPARPEALPRLPASVATAALPAVQIDDLPADTPVARVAVELVIRSLPSLRALLCSITALAALVPDFLCSGALDIAAELGVPGYVFVPSHLTWIALVRHFMELNHGVDAPAEYRDLPDPLELPGGLSLRRADLSPVYRDRNRTLYPVVLEAARRYRRADGLLVNTFFEMEPATVEAFKLATEQGAFPPVFPVGPCVRPSSEEDGASSPCLEWLDRQQEGSVVYVAFGSGGALSAEQTVELAAGLEESGHRFLWVVRMPSLDQGTRGRADVDDDPLTWLPEGFLERTKGRGLAVSAWVSQVRVLSHRATAAFVSHCGCNSTLESVQSGVSMVAWPLYAEQGMNAVILEGKVGVALRPPARADGLVVRQEIADAVKEIMEGEKGLAVRNKAAVLQRAAARALSPEGSSRRALEQVAAKWKAALDGES